MKRFLKYVSLALLLIPVFYLSAAENTYSCFGIRADKVVINNDSIAEPSLSRTKKAFVTENKFGFDTISSKLNWVTQSFINFIKPGIIVLDVGAGYGALSRLALDRGATVINNEVSRSQQYYTLKFIKQNQKQRLYLHNQDIRKASFPEEAL